MVYEPFWYPLGDDVLTPLNGGTGFAGSWVRAEEGSNDSITVYDGAPGTGGSNTPQGSPGDRDGTFNNVAVATSGPAGGNRYIDNGIGDDRLTANRQLSQSAGTLAGGDKILWASVLWTMNGSNFGRQVGFVLGTDGLRNRSQNISTNTSWGGSGDGNAIGVGGAINSQSVTPTIWAGGNQVVRTTAGAKSLATNQDNIVILKFVFADGATPDTVHAWGFGENETIDETTFDANAISASAVIDQDTLNIVSFGQSVSGVETVDEIRLGDTFADVVSIPAAGAADGAASVVTASPLVVASDGATASTIAVTLVDSLGIPVSGHTVTLAGDTGNAAISGGGATDSNGQVTFTVTSTTSETEVFTATDTTAAVVITQTASVIFEPEGTIDPAVSTVEASPLAVPADDFSTSTVTVTLNNVLGDPVSGKDVTLVSDGDATISPGGVQVTDVNGQVTFTVRSGTVGTQTFTATDVTNDPPPASIPVTQTASVTFFETSPTPSLLFHEPFDYADGTDLNGQGGWSAGTNTAGGFIEIFDGTGSEPWDGVFGGVTQSGNFAGESQSPNADHLYADNALDPSVTATFTDGAVTWFSFIRYAGRPQAGIGADRLRNRGEVADGQNIGMGAVFNSDDVRAHYWDDEDTNGSFEQHSSSTTLGNSNPHFVIARIVWSDVGEDTITVARFASGATITEAEFDSASQSTISANLDETLFDTVSIAGNNYYIDEIRIATTFDLAVNGVGGGGSPFDTWAGTGSLGPVTFDGDTNGDGVQDGIAFLLGVTNPDDDANGALPTVTEDGSGNLVMVFDCLATADRGTAILKVAHSNTLASFTAAADPVPDADGADTDGDVSYVVDTVSVAPLNKVTATISSSVSAGGKLFGRLQATE